MLLNYKEKRKSDWSKLEGHTSAIGEAVLTQNRSQPASTGLIPEDLQLSILKDMLGNIEGIGDFSMNSSSSGSDLNSDESL